MTMTNSAKVGSDPNHKTTTHHPAAIEWLFVTLMIDDHDEPSRRLTIDIDATHDPIHGEQEGRHFNAFYDCAAIYRCRSSSAGTCSPLYYPSVNLVTFCVALEALMAGGSDVAVHEALCDFMSIMSCGGPRARGCKANLASLTWRLLNEVDPHAKQYALATFQRDIKGQSIGPGTRRSLCRRFRRWSRA
jgi:Transposase DDE domain group 1